MPRTRSKKQNVRLSVTLDKNEYAALTWLGEEPDLSAAWMIQRAVSEFVVHHRGGIANDLPLRPPEAKTAAEKKSGGSREK